MNDKIEIHPFHMCSLRVYAIEEPPPGVAYTQEPITLPFPDQADFERWLNGISDADMARYLETGALPDGWPR